VEELLFLLADEHEAVAGMVGFEEWVAGAGGEELDVAYDQPRLRRPQRVGSAIVGPGPPPEQDWSTG